jgi:hypothetical protein
MASLLLAWSNARGRWRAPARRFLNEPNCRQTARIGHRAREGRGYHTAAGATRLIGWPIKGETRVGNRVSRVGDVRLLGAGGAAGETWRVAPSAETGKPCVTFVYPKETDAKAGRRRCKGSATARSQAECEDQGVG